MHSNSFFIQVLIDLSQELTGAQIVEIAKAAVGDPKRFHFYHDRANPRLGHNVLPACGQRNLTTHELGDCVVLVHRQGLFSSQIVPGERYDKIIIANTDWPGGQRGGFYVGIEEDVQTETIAYAKRVRELIRAALSAAA
jgi:hypothetical protein